MSQLARRSALVLALLFGLVFSVGVGVMYYLDVPMAFAIVFALVVVGTQYLVGPLIIDSVFKIRWTNASEVSGQFGEWYRAQCKRAGMREPRFGIIPDGNPNAFAYGRTRRDARVVVTAGLLDMLTPEEAQAVVAHELGHVEHRDFIVMTAAQAAPLILYIAYIWTRRVRGSYAFLVSIGAYAVYILSQYIVLLLSRTREFFADEASAQATRNPNLLSSALVKICYGLARSPAAASGHLPIPGSDAEQKKSNKNKWVDPAVATAAMCIASARESSAFAMSASDATGSFSSVAMADAMQWELKNPWAKWFELNSTHPLTARRVLALNKAAGCLGIPGAFGLESRFSSLEYTGHFALEILVYCLPLMGAVVGAVLGRGQAGGWELMAGYGLIGFAIGRGVKAAMAYPRMNETVRTVQDLVGQEINASPMAPVPCVVEGEIIGRGVPGLFYSPDLVLRDRTGFIRTLYRQPLGSIMRPLFGITKAERLIGQKVRVHGWYRRAQAPYLEIYRIEPNGMAGDTVRCHFGSWMFASAALALLAGCVLVMAL